MAVACKESTFSFLPISHWIFTMSVPSTVECRSLIVCIYDINHWVPLDTVKTWNLLTIIVTANYFKSQDTQIRSPIKNTLIFYWFQANMLYHYWVGCKVYCLDFGRTSKTSEIDLEKKVKWIKKSINTNQIDVFLQILKTTPLRVRAVFIRLFGSATFTAFVLATETCSKMASRLCQK